jgi:DNA-binding response OmpR family regulator
MSRTPSRVRQDLLARIHNGNFDALLLDWDVADLNGIEVLKRVREHNRGLTILFCTARGEEAVKALCKGADAYLVKPVRRMELLECVQSVIRRTRRPQEPGGSSAVGSIRVDLDTRTIERNGKHIKLTIKDFDLAVFFWRNLGRLISRAQIHESVWNRGGCVTSRTVDTHVSRIRTKLGLIPSNGWRLAAVYRHGYCLERVDSSGESTQAGVSDASTPPGPRLIFGSDPPGLSASVR